MSLESSDGVSGFSSAFDRNSLAEEGVLWGCKLRMTPRPESNTGVALDRRMHFFFLSEIIALFESYVGSESV